MRIVEQVESGIILITGHGDLETTDIKIIYTQTQNQRMQLGVNNFLSLDLARHGTSPTILYGLRKRTQGSSGGLKVNASVRDTDTLFAAFQTLGGLLVALAEVRLHHDTHNGVFTLAELFLDGLEHLGLVAVVLLGVAFSSNVS